MAAQPSVLERAATTPPTNATSSAASATTSAASSWSHVTSPLASSLASAPVFKVSLILLDFLVLPSCLLPSMSMVMARVGSLSQSCSAITTASLDWPVTSITCWTLFLMSGSSCFVGSLIICASLICSGVGWTLGMKPSGGLACPSVAVTALGDCVVAADGDLFPRSRLLFPALCVLLELIT